MFEIFISDSLMKLTKYFKYDLNQYIIKLIFCLIIYNPVEELT